MKGSRRFAVWGRVTRIIGTPPRVTQGSPRRLSPPSGVRGLPPTCYGTRRVVARGTRPVYLRPWLSAGRGWRRRPRRSRHPGAGGLRYGARPRGADLGAAERPAQAGGRLGGPHFDASGATTMSQRCCGQRRRRQRRLPPRSEADKRVLPHRGAGRAGPAAAQAPACNRCKKAPGLALERGRRLCPVCPWPACPGSSGCGRARPRRQLHGHRARRKRRGGAPVAAEPWAAPGMRPRPLPPPCVTHRPGGPVIDKNASPGQPWPAPPPSRQRTASGARPAADDRPRLRTGAMI
jgi:hypothetical protein